MGASVILENGASVRNPPDVGPHFWVECDLRPAMNDVHGLVGSPDFPDLSVDWEWHRLPLHIMPYPDAGRVGWRTLLTGWGFCFKSPDEVSGFLEGEKNCVTAAAMTPAMISFLRLTPMRTHLFKWGPLRSFQ